MTVEATSAFDGRTTSPWVHSIVTSIERCPDEPPLDEPDEHGSLDAGEVRIRVGASHEAWRDAQHELFDLAPEALLVTDHAAVVRTVNVAAARMFEVDGRRLRARGLVERVEPDDRASFWAAVKRATRGVGEVNVWLHDRLQGRVLVTLRGAAARDGRRIVWSARLALAPSEDASRIDELTEALRERDDQLARALARCEALEAEQRSRDASLALLAHELRGPTDVIIGWSRLLRGGGTNEHEQARAMATIERSAVAQSVLVDDLVEASRLAAKKLRVRLERTDLGEVVRSAVEAVRPTADQRTVAIECEASAGLMVPGDRSRLAQVLANLLSNALKFTQGGGTIAVRCGLQPGHAGRRAVVEVSDSGIGIDANEIGHLFEYRRHFHSSRRRSGGLGLGLFLVREFVEMHGGTVAARSAGKGHGATFVVSLPLQAG